MRFFKYACFALIFGYTYPASALPITVPPISNCQEWKAIDREVYLAHQGGAQREKYLDEAVGGAHSHGWPYDAAKQLLVVILAAFDDPPVSEDQFVADQFAKCEVVAKTPGPKYPNVTIGLYWTPEQNAEADRTWKKMQERPQRQLECLELKREASLIFVRKRAGVPFDTTLAWASSRAYGPNGEVYRDSADAESILTALVKAAYFGDPKTWRDENGHQTDDYATQVYASCMRDAS
jgi:hypothetical protein